MVTEEDLRNMELHETLEVRMKVVTEEELHKRSSKKVLQERMRRAGNEVSFKIAQMDPELVVKNEEDGEQQFTLFGHTVAVMSGYTLSATYVMALAPGIPCRKHDHELELLTCKIDEDCSPAYDRVRLNCLLLRYHKVNRRVYPEMYVGF